SHWSKNGGSARGSAVANVPAPSECRTPKSRREGCREKRNWPACPPGFTLGVPPHRRGAAHYDLLGFSARDHLTPEAGAAIVLSTKHWIVAFRLLSLSAGAQGINPDRHDFENDEAGKAPSGWVVTTPGYEAVVTRDRPW